MATLDNLLPQDKALALDQMDKGGFLWIYKPCGCHEAYRPKSDDWVISYCLEHAQEMAPDEVLILETWEPVTIGCPDCEYWNSDGPRTCLKPEGEQCPTK